MVANSGVRPAGCGYKMKRDGENLEVVNGIFLIKHRKERLLAGYSH